MGSIGRQIGTIAAHAIGGPIAGAAAGAILNRPPGQGLGTSLLNAGASLALGELSGHLIPGGKQESKVQNEQQFQLPLGDLRTNQGAFFAPGMQQGFGGIANTPSFFGTNTPNVSLPQNLLGGGFNNQNRQFGQPGFSLRTGRLL